MPDTTEQRLLVNLCTEIGTPMNLDLATSTLPDLGCDVLDLHTLIMAVEDDFGITVSDDEAEPFWDVPLPLSELVALIEGKLGVQNADA